MSTMAVFVIFSVIVACSVQVFAIDCSAVSLGDLRNCDDCIRCGGNWCKKGGKKPCVSDKDKFDNWCEGDKEELPFITSEYRGSSTISPIFSATTASIGRGQRTTFNFSAPQEGGYGRDNLKVIVGFLNSTQSNNYKFEEDKDCSGKVCMAYISLIPDTNFCYANGSTHEYLYVSVEVESVKEKPTLKYHVPCACACSKQVQKNAAVCGGKGDYSCGVCTCHNGWSGEFCEKKEICKGDRGDADEMCKDSNGNTSVVCSGNGYCAACEKCICHKYGEGWQYFLPSSYCANLGQVVSTVGDTCLRNTDLVDGPCPNTALVFVPCNTTRLLEKDEFNRTVWVEFQHDAPNNEVFAAMMDFKTNATYVMRKSLCINGSAFVSGHVNVTVPVVLGVLALLAAVTAAGGYAVWKARHAPAPLSASQYKELEPPVASEGINPFYRDPLSTYNNPLYKGCAKV